MKSTLSVVFVSAILFAGCSSQPSPDDVFLRLNEDQIEIDRREFAGLETRLYVIDTDVPLYIGFKTHPSEQQKATIQTPNNRPRPKAAEIQEVDGPGWYRSTLGSDAGQGCMFVPMDGKIKINAVNNCDSPLRIVLYHRPCTAREIASLKSAGVWE